MRDYRNKFLKEDVTCSLKIELFWNQLSVEQNKRTSTCKIFKKFASRPWNICLCTSLKSLTIQGSLSLSFVHGNSSLLHKFRLSFFLFLPKVSLVLTTFVFFWHIFVTLCIFFYDSVVLFGNGKRNEILERDKRGRRRAEGGKKRENNIKHTSSLCNQNDETEDENQTE